MPIYTYTGTVDISGVIEASSGGESETVNFFGDFAGTVTATLDSTGSGTATETLDGSISVSDGWQTGSASVDITTPSFAFELGTFELPSPAPAPINGLTLDITVTGTDTNSLTQISENVTIDLSGTYNGYTFFGNVNGSALLTTPPLTITGTETRLTTDTSNVLPMPDVVVTDPNAGQTDTATVTLSNAANGTLSNLDGGSYNATTGVYTVSGSAADVSSAVDGLVFTPTIGLVPAGETLTTGFAINVTDTSGASANASASVVATEAGLVTLASFSGANGDWPIASVTADGSGNLFGTTWSGGANGDGDVFEIAMIDGRYASTPTVLASFDGVDGAGPVAGLSVDHQGDLFGTTSAGGANGDGEVFEVVKSGSGYASTPTVLASFDKSDGAAPQSGLIFDNNGDLFGTTSTGGAKGDGAVFEIANNDGVYASTPTVLASFDGPDGATPFAGLIFGADGNLLGTTSAGGANGDGEVFEVAKTASGYAAVPAVVASFDGTDGASPQAGLITDSNGDLFGTTSGGGQAYDGTTLLSGLGTVFEIARSGGSYASTPISLASFNQADGSDFNVSEPASGLIADAAGDLIGTTNGGGPDQDGTVFELAKTANGYASAPTSLAIFSNGEQPTDGLIADAAGHLIGTTQGGGTSGDGSVFELACYLRGTGIATPAGERAIETLAAGDLVLTASGEAQPIAWIGHCRVDCRHHPQPYKVWPVRVCPDAFGRGRPHRDLWLSPDHAVFLDGVLIPIRCLVNGKTIAQARRDIVSYWHVELTRHDVLLAEGLPAESYLDTGNRGAFDNAGGPTVLYPDVARRIWQANACAEQILGGPPLILAKRRTHAQAILLGHTSTNDPNLRIFARSRELLAKIDGNHWTVRLPEGIGEARLISRACVPAHVQSDESDTRLLGVAIGCMWLDGREIGLESPGLCSGWNAPEPGRRWTDGDATLALTNVNELAFDVVMTSTYWGEAERGQVRAA